MKARAAIWIILALLFNGWIYLAYGSEAAASFLAAYLLEQALSLDNLFVFLLIFHHLQIKGDDQRRVLLWGLFGAVVLRGLFIWGGITLIHRFEWLLAVLGVFLIYSGVALALRKGHDVPLEHSRIYAWVKKRFKAYPLVPAIIMVELTDLIFAVDSIPAVFGITTDPLIVYSSNIFAVLSLRSLFFVLEEWMSRLSFLHTLLGGILVLIGLKMVFI